MKENPYGNIEIVRRDFIEKLTQELRFLFKGVSPTWAETCARTTLGTILDKVKIAYAGKPLSVNQFNLCIGPPGVIKTLPLEFCREIISRVDQKTKYDYLLPSKFTSPSMIQHLSELRKDSPKWPKKYKHNHGTIFRDEFTALFKQAREVEYMSDMLEFLSELYDGSVQKKRTVERGVEEAPVVNVNLLSATTYDFLSKVDDDFFTQGTGTRFLYTVIDFDDIEIKKFERKHFLGKVIEERDQLINTYADWLAQLSKAKELTTLFLEHKAYMKWNDYYVNNRKKWMSLGKKDPMGWEYPYLVRMPEYVLKLAGIYSVSKNIDKIIRAHDKKKEKYLKDFSVNISDINRAIKKVEEHINNFRKLVHLRRTIVGKWKPKSHTQCVNTVTEVLKTFPNKMANYSQWYAIQTVCSSQTTFQKYKLTAIATKKVKEVDKTTIKDEKERKRLNANKPATKIYQALY